MGTKCPYTNLAFEAGFEFAVAVVVAFDFRFSFPSSATE